MTFRQWFWGAAWRPLYVVAGIADRLARRWDGDGLARACWDAIPGAMWVDAKRDEPRQ